MEEAPKSVTEELKTEDAAITNRWDEMSDEEVMNAPFEIDLDSLRD